MKDIAGQEVKVGDVVAMTSMETAQMQLGLVLRFTPKGIRVGYINGTVIPSGEDWRRIRDTPKVSTSVAKIVEDTEEVKAFLQTYVALQLKQDIASSGTTS